VLVGAILLLLGPLKRERDAESAGLKKENRG
jgi:hypothetical protein